MRGDPHRGTVCIMFSETLCKGHKQISEELLATIIVYKSAFLAADIRQKDH